MHTYTWARSGKRSRVPAGNWWNVATPGLRHRLGPAWPQLVPPGSRSLLRPEEPDESPECLRSPRLSNPLHCAGSSVANYSAVPGHRRHQTRPLRESPTVHLVHATAGEAARPRWIPESIGTPLADASEIVEHRGPTLSHSTGLPSGCMTKVKGWGRQCLTWGQPDPRGEDGSAGFQPGRFLEFSSTGCGARCCGCRKRDGDGCAGLTSIPAPDM